MAAYADVIIASKLTGNGLTEATKNSRALASAVSRLDNDVKRLSGAVNPTTRATHALADAQEKMFIAVATGRTDMQTAIQTLKGYEAQLRATERASNDNATNVRKLGGMYGNSAIRMQQLSFQLNDIGMGLATGQAPMQVMIQQGSQLAQVYGGQGGLTHLTRDLGSMVRTLATRFGPAALAVGTLTAVTAGMAHEISAATGESVTMGDVVTGTFGMLRDGVRDVVAPAFAALAPHAATAWKGAVDVTGFAVNHITRRVMKGAASIRSVLNTSAAVVGVTVAAVVGEFERPIEAFLNGVVGAVNRTIDVVDAVAQRFGGGGIAARAPVIDFQTADGQDLRSLPAKVSEIMAASVRSVRQAHADIDNTDFAGGAFSGIADRAVEASRRRQAAAGGEGANDNRPGKGGKGVGVVAAMRSQYSAALAVVEEFAEQRRAIEERMQTQAVGLWQQSTQQILGNLQTLGSEGTAIYKAMFLANQAAAVANAIVNTAQGVSKAVAMGPPGLPLVPIIKAAGMMQIATIAATTVQGFERGGLIPAGRRIIEVNEAGQEMVMNAGATARHRPALEAMNAGGSAGGSGGTLTLNVDGVLAEMLAPYDGELARISAKADGAYNVGRANSRALQRASRKG